MISDLAFSIWSIIRSAHSPPGVKHTLAGVLFKIRSAAKDKGEKAKVTRATRKRALTMDFFTAAP